MKSRFLPFIKQQIIRNIDVFFINGVAMTCGGQYEEFWHFYYYCSRSGQLVYNLLKGRNGIVLSLHVWENRYISK